jgi:hypothetical protein
MLWLARALIKEADPEVVEEWKWSNPVVAQRADLHRRDLQEGREDDLRQGSVVAGPFKPFTSSPDGNVRRAIDVPKWHPGREGSKALIRAAVALNKSSARG